ncbi:MAG: hypothetical protein U0840_04135 [Gemmataceae bacterium]
MRTTHLALSPHFLAIAVAACLTLSASAQPRESLAGEWRADLSDTHSLVMRLGRDSVEVAIAEGGVVRPLWAGKMTFPEGEADRHFDWVGLSNAMPDNKCLYRLAGDTLLVIGGGPDRRPTRFISGPGNGSRTLIFTRVRK